MPRALIALATVLVACGSAPEPVSLVVRAPTGIDLREARWSGETRVVHADATARTLALDVLPGASSTLTVEHDGACPLVVPQEPDGELTIEPFLRVPDDQPQAGFDASFEITIEPGCREGLAGSITWADDATSALALTTSRNGFVVRGRLRPLSLDHAPTRGIVPISPRTRDAHALVGTWHGRGHADVEIRVRVAAAARATGLPSVPLGTRLLLAGGPWTITTSPPHTSPTIGRGEIARVGETPVTLDWIEIGQPGEYVLADGAGTPMTLRAGGHASTPLDCGRAECHASATSAAQPSAMTHAIEHDLAGRDVGCAFCCHAVGEPGLPDEGFAHVARELELDPRHLGFASMDEMPRGLRRVAGVGCTACHGPGAIPEPDASWAILRADVCATCHDAPPSYTTVADSASTRMARADADATTREGTCAGCHTTAGFLARIGVRPAGDVARTSGFGIACAACHAPHDASSIGRLVRAIPWPSSLGAPIEPVRASAGSVCLGCHAPEGAITSAASLVLGRGTGGTAAPHADVPSGCVGCHRGAAADDARSVRHDFASDAATCTPCHESAPLRDPTLRTRALALAARLGIDPSGPHPTLGATADDTTRAVALVLADPAADVHGGALARAVLDAAEASGR